MKPAEFLSALDEKTIVAEIAAAEAKTSGEIRVYISSKTIDDALARAAARFEKLGMRKTRERNGVLIYFAPRVRKFAVIGDIAIHEKCGPAFWEEVIAETREHLKASHFTEAIVHAVRKAGDVLARHFPRAADDRNELPDAIERD